MKTIHRNIYDIFGRYNRFSETAIRNFMDKFESSGLVHSIPTTLICLGHLSYNIDKPYF